MVQKMFMIDGVVGQDGSTRDKGLNGLAKADQKTRRTLFGVGNGAGEEAEGLSVSRAQLMRGEDSVERRAHGSSRRIEKENSAEVVREQSDDIGLLIGNQSRGGRHDV